MFRRFYSREKMEIRKRKKSHGVKRILFTQVCYGTNEELNNNYKI
jgi:hypothetical protein